MRRRSSFGPWAALIVAGVLIAVPEYVRPTELVERVFEITHRSVEDAYLTISDLLGPEGEVSISKARSRLTVRDDPALLAEIGQALATFDVPPRRVRMQLRLGWQTCQLEHRRKKVHADNGRVAHAPRLGDTRRSHNR